MKGANSMSILKKLKNVYDAIETPQELDYVVNKSIHQGKMEKKNRYRTYIKFATSAVVTTFALFVILLNTNESFAKSMENIPVISKLAEVFTINEYEESNEIDLIKAKVPAIRNTGNTDLENRINYEISTKINDIIEEAKNRAEEYKEAVLATGGTMENFIPIEINVDYEITYQDDNIISFVITKSESMASAYQEQYFYNIDLENGKELNLKDVLGANYKEIVDEEVKKQIVQREKEDENNMYFTEDEGGFSGIEDEYHDFYIDKNRKATIVFQKYEIAPGYMGIQSFEIPDEILV